MPRRRRRPIFLVAILALLALSELEVVSTAHGLASVVQSSALAFFLARIVPLAAVAFLLAPLIHLPRLRAHRDSFPEWILLGYVTPAYLFLLACFAHAFFGALFDGGRWLVGLGLPSTSMRLFDLSLPFVLALYGGVFGQLWTRVERGLLVLPGMGAELAGLRVVQLSDLHAGGMVGARRLRRIARQVARLKPDLVVVTGDIVNASPHEAELVAPILAALPAKLGIWACLGNHDHFVDGDAVAAILERAGVRVLRNRGEVIQRGSSAFWLAGVDDTWTRRDDLDAALADKPEGLPVLLLAHDPAVWPAAVARHVDVTLSGHTHGGQFGLVKLHPALSLARLMTPFTAGRFQKEGSVLHVSRGTANTLPIRLGAPTEVGLFDLVDRPPRPSVAPHSFLVMKLRSLLLLLPFAAACGTTADSDGTDPLGSAQFWVKSSVAAADGTTRPSFTVDAEFLLPGATSCATSTMGAATINPCLSPSPSVQGSDVTSAGKVTVVTSTITEALEPESDGDYATGTFDTTPWTMGGDSITIGWAHFPGTTTGAGGTFVATTPPYVTLSPGSAFAEPTSTIDRTADLTFSWTSDEVPANGDLLGVYFDTGSTQVGVNFDLSAGTGVVPASALQTLSAGEGSFDIHSKRSTDEKQTAPDGSTWSFTFNIDAEARTSSGVASGKVTFR